MNENYKNKEIRNEIKAENDTIIVYHCGCAESKLESPEYWVKHCPAHHNFIPCDDSPATCLCGKQEKLNKGGKK